MRDNFLDKVVYSRAGFYQHHYPARPLQVFHHLVQRMRTYDLGALCLPAEKVVHFTDGAVESDYSETVVVHIENQILTHYRQADQGYICCGLHRHNITQGDEGLGDV